MPDKNLSWNINERKKIWETYNKNIFPEIWNKKIDLDDFDFAYESPCYKCGKVMLKEYYQGTDPDKSHSWFIDYIDGNPNNRDFSNIRLIHPQCVDKKKIDKTTSKLFSFKLKKDSF